MTVRNTEVVIYDSFNIVKIYMSGNITKVRSYHWIVYLLI
jgi:hypothetical protein